MRDPPVTTFDFTLLFSFFLSLFFLCSSLQASVLSFFFFLFFFLSHLKPIKKIKKQTFLSLFFAASINFFFFFFFCWPLLLLLLLLFWLWWVLEFLRSKTSSFVTVGCSGGFNGGCCDGWDFRSLIWEKHKNKDHGGLD